VDYHWGLLVGAGIAGLVELASVPPDDNFTIPLATGAAMYFMGV
jgi:dolichol kinase